MFPFSKESPHERAKRSSHPEWRAHRNRRLRRQPEGYGPVRPISEDLVGDTMDVISICDSNNIFPRYTKDYIIEEIVKKEAKYQREM